MKTLLKNPKILLLDEPTSALDKETALLFVEHLNKIKKDKIIIMVTHDADLIKYATKVIRLKDGVLYEEANYECN